MKIALLQFKTALSLGTLVAVALGLTAHSLGQEIDPKKNTLNLADLADYRAALSGAPAAGNAKATDKPLPVRFRDLWEQPEALCGRRVIVRGRVERIFRQAAVGSFPPLAEVWIISPAGDPFCVVFPQNEPNAGDNKPHGQDRTRTTSHDLNGRGPARSLPALGRTVRFTGTYLKMVSYAASDGKRLAPLIVGERPPVYSADSLERDDATSPHEGFTQIFGGDGDGSSQSGRERWPWSGANWVLALAMAALAGGIIAWQHMRTPGRRHRLVRERRESLKTDDPPLEFIN